MTWDLIVAKPARKELDRAPERDRQRILAALRAMREDPFSGDIARLKNQPTAWRRRVGDWRIFFDSFPEQRTIEVVAIRRRTPTTY